MHTRAFAADPADSGLLEKPVDRRVHPDFAIEGIKYRGFVIQPMLGTGLSYNDNIYATQNNEKSDFIYTVNPSLNISKRYGSHSFYLSGNGNFSQYQEYDNENKQAYEFKTGGTIGVSENTDLIYKLDYDKSYLTRQEPGNSRYTKEPVEKYKKSAELALSRDFNRLNLSLIGNVARKTFKDGVSQTTGGPLTYSDRDHNIYGTTLRVAYDLLRGKNNSPEYVLFAEVSRTQNRFDKADSTTGLSSDSDQTGFLAGISTKYKGIIFGKLAAGYFMQDFKDSKDIGRYDIAANLGFNITPKTTLTFDASRDVTQDNSFVNGFVNTTFSGGVDHELLHDTYIGAVQSYNNRDFLGPQSGRTDDVYASSIYLRHNHSRNLESKMEVTRTSQSSNATNADFDQNIFMLYLTGRF